MGERPFDDFAALLTALGGLADEAPDRPALTCYRGLALTGKIQRLSKSQRR